MSDEHTRCTDCHDTGASNGDYCGCRMGVALRTAPRIRIGDEVLVFPPGTTMAEAQSVVDEAQRRYLESLS